MLLSAIASGFSEYAYVIHDLDYRKNTRIIKEYFSELDSFYLLGRWGSWNYNNMDLCMRDAMELVENKFMKEKKDD